MKKKIMTKINILILIALFLYFSSITPQTVAIGESITITSYGCSSCSMEENSYSVDWNYSGNISSVSIYLYDVTMTTIKYTVIENTPNLGTYEWSMPVSHTLDGNHSLVVCDYNNNSIKDSVFMNVYPIQTFTPPIPGYPMLLVTCIILITTVITIATLSKKLRKR
ncbi:MAG: hypothetical protein ACFE88_11890 [Candidatus Hermodarchaeota archaeon]